MILGKMCFWIRRHKSVFRLSNKAFQKQYKQVVGGSCKLLLLGLQIYVLCCFMESSNTIMKKYACHELKKEIRLKIGGLDNEIVA
jgi:hypothetical protein